jgi:hypothetical protein
MRLIEFYNPEMDEFVKRSSEDTRKSKLTLEEIGKLRKVRDLKSKEKDEHDKFVKVMYANPTQDGGGGLV